MSGYSLAKTICPFCKGVVSVGETKCRWCSSTLQLTVSQAHGQARQPLSWSRADRAYADHFAWRALLSPGDPVVVAEGEGASQIQGGKLRALLPYGTSQVSGPGPNPDAFESVGVLFSRTGVQTFNWGQGDLATADGITVGVSGTISVRQSDPVKLLPLFPAGQPYLSMKDLKSAVIRVIEAAVQTAVSTWLAHNLLGAGLKLGEIIVRQLGVPLGGMGLELANFEVRSVNLPEEFRRAVEKQGIRAIEMKGDLEKLEQMKRLGVDVSKLAAMDRLAEKASGLQIVQGDLIAGPAIRDSILLRTHVGDAGKPIGDVPATTGMGLSIECPKCKSSLEASHRFCANCGTRFRACPNCRIAIPDPGRYCFECGGLLT